MALGLADWTEPALRAWVDRELGFAEANAAYRTPELTAVWIAGSIPTNILSLLAAPLLTGSAVYAHAPREDPQTLRTIVESLAEIDPVTASAIAVGDDRAVLAHADAVIAEGREATLREIRAATSTHTAFVGYGPKLSLAAIGASADADDASACAALDIALFDGRGCLSPAIVAIEDRPSGRARDIAARIASHLARLATELPRGSVAPVEHLGLHELRAEWCAHPDAEAFMAGSCTQYGVVLLPESATPRPGTLRNVPALALASDAALEALCRRLAPSLSALGHTGFALPRAALARAAARGGASRLCPLGHMQRPPLAWRHDGRGTIEALLRYIDIEPGA
jgi:hypothetical protein